MSSSATAILSGAEVEFVKITDIKVGLRRRKKVGDLRSLKASIEEHGLFHPIMLRSGNELVAGERRLEACRSLGWSKVPTRDVGDLSDEDLRAIELDENSTRIDLTPGESTRQWLADIRRREEKERANSCPKSGTPVKARGHRQGEKSGSVRSRAEASGLPRQTVQRLDEHAEAVEKFPVLEAWPKSDAIKAAKQLEKLPEEEHSMVAAIMERPDVPEEVCKRILKNLPTVPPEKRAAIYEAAQSSDPDRSISAISVASALPPNPEPAILIGLEAVRVLTRWTDRLAKINEPALSAEVEAWRDRADEIRKRLEGRKVQL